MQTLFVVGNNVDRKFLSRVQKEIASDADILSLIRKGRRLLLWRLLTCLLAIVAMILGAGGSIREFGEWVTVSGVVVFCFSAAFSIKELMEVTAQSMSLKKYPYHLWKTRRLSPLELWKYIPGSVADVQMLSLSSRLIGKDIGVIYAGVPYYETFFIDSFTLKWHSHKKGSRKVWHRWQTKRAFRRFFIDFSQNTVVAMAENSCFKKGIKHIEYSNSVFGMLFTSQYLLREIERSSELKLDEKKKIRIFVSVPEEKEAQCAVEWMKYCTNQKYFMFVSSSLECDLEITSLSLYKKEKRRTRHRDGEIRIPVKRFIAMPFEGEHHAVSSQEQVSMMPFPQTVVDEFFRDGGCHVFCIGGAEQNLALQCIINAYRWSEKRFQTGCRMGFAENSFEVAGENTFLMGTEGLVYGVKGDVIGRLAAKENSGNSRSEIYHLTLGEDKNFKVDLYGVYGYSAMATKMSLCQLLYSKYLKGKNVDHVDYESMVPGERYVIDDLFGYLLTKDGGVLFKSEEGKTWDREDFMNHPEKLLAWLSDAEKNHICVVEG